MYQSFQAISNPEFINLQPLDINPLMSKCEIKVFYLGNNRNKTSISKSVASEMAKTLRGSPIVGYFNKDKDDFADHGEKVTIDSDGIHFSCETQPYGFVDPAAKVWFQDFQEEDGTTHETVTRTYLMTTGYIWDGQYQEAKSIVENGKAQSMELDDKKISGNWTTEEKSGLSFFIINDAMFKKLCILGDSVEPCFEGASVTAPNISSQFNLEDNSFQTTLYSMLQDLKKYVLNEGGSQMEPVKDNQPAVAQVDTTVEAVAATNFVNKKDEDEKPAAPKKDEPAKEKETDSKEKDSAKKDEEDEKKKEAEKKYAALEQKYNDLTAQFQKMQSDYATLVDFKKAIDNEKKDNLINEFSMLSAEDKKDIIANKENLSYSEIESQLSVMCYRKKINFTEPEVKKEDAPALTYSEVNQSGNSGVPAWVLAVKQTQKNREME